VLGWVIREAATNVIRHSGAKVCEVTVSVDRTATRVEIRDTGHGYRLVTGPGDTARHGVGLVGLRERVIAAGGTLTTGNAPRGGFRVIATMPVAAGVAATTSDSTANDPPTWAVGDDANPAAVAPSAPAMADALISEAISEEYVPALDSDTDVTAARSDGAAAGAPSASAGRS
jgi:hypothetical protein